MFLPKRKRAIAEKRWVFAEAEEMVKTAKAELKAAKEEARLEKAESVYIMEKQGISPKQIAATAKISEDQISSFIMLYLDSQKIKN